MTAWIIVPFILLVLMFLICLLNEKRIDKIQSFETNITSIFENTKNTLLEKTEEIKAKQTQPSIVSAEVSAADELLKYKKLLDAGALTQEEYDAKKKQLLGL